MVSVFIKTATLAASFLVLDVEGHSNMVIPAPKWPDGFYNKNSPSGTISEPATLLPIPKGMTYSAGQDSNTEAFWTAFNASSYKSLKEFIWKNQKLADGASNECGFSLVDGEPQPLPDVVEWTTMGHGGPLQIECDDTIVASIYNAAVETPEKVPYDKAKCQGASMLTSYWLALHATPWQVYVNCARLSGGSSNTATPKGDTPSGTPSPSSGNNGTPPSNTPGGTPSPSSGNNGTPPSTPSGNSPNGGAPAPTPNNPGTNKCSRRI